jgi:sRNA-binding carbon storage regulator CsrA
MLALTLEPGKPLYFEVSRPCQFTLQVVRVKGEYVVVGIDAPQSVQVERDDVHYRRLGESSSS